MDDRQYRRISRHVKKRQHPGSTFFSWGVWVLSDLASTMADQRRVMPPSGRRKEWRSEDQSEAAVLIGMAACARPRA